MLVESTGTAIVVAKIRGGKFDNLKFAQMNKWYLFIASFALEFFSVYMGSRGHIFFINNILYIHLLSYSVLFYTFYHNRNQLAFKVIALGVLLNFIVIMANGGHMPVSADAMLKCDLVKNYEALKAGKIITHALIDDKTKLAFLGDVFMFKKPYPRPKVFSIGDTIMAIGVFIYIQKNMVIKSGAFRR